jgi:hypothetical protein
MFSGFGSETLRDGINGGQETISQSEVYFTTIYDKL